MSSSLFRSSFPQAVENFSVLLPDWGFFLPLNRRGRGLFFPSDEGGVVFVGGRWYFDTLFCLRRVTFLAEEKSPKVRLEPRF